MPKKPLISKSKLNNALQNLLENKATSDDLNLLKDALSNGQITIGGNVKNSVIIVGSGNSVQLSPEALEQLSSTKEIAEEIKSLLTAKGKTRDLELARRDY